MLPASQPIHGPVVATASIGNISSPLTQVVISSATAVAVYIGVRWDGDKVRGVRMELSDGTVQQAGGFDDANTR